MQRLQLLFYLLLPPKLLHSFLHSHPAGGPPLWLLEVGNDIVLSMASLSHYYWFGDTFAPATLKGRGSTDDSMPAERSKLVLDGLAVASIIKMILTQPSSNSSDGSRTPNGGSGESPANGNRNASAAQPAKKQRLRRRASRELNEDDFAVVPPQSEVMERLANAPFILEDYVNDDISTRDVLEDAAATLETKKAVTMEEFLDFCQGAIGDDALDAIMNRFFAHSILPSPSMEAELVKSRWEDWQEAEGILYTKAMQQPEGTLEILTHSVRKILSLEKGEEFEIAPGSKSKRKPFGDIGGFDGRGGLGFGVMYCVDKKWWDCWTSYVRWSWAGETKNMVSELNERTRRRPAELSSESLLNRLDDEIVAGTYGSYELMKLNLKKDEHYVLIPPSVWDVLYEIYGGGPPLPRMVKPPKSDSSSTSTTEMLPIHACGPVSIDAGRVPSGLDLDAMASTDNLDRVLRIPQQMEVETHPWVLHLHLCDPQQPYRRGYAGSLSVRVMVSPEQSFWRFYGELVTRLPFHLFRAYGADGRGKTRLWKRTDPSGPKDAMTRFGPWTLLCKNRHAILPQRDAAVELEENLEELKENWETFADNASLESIGLSNGDQLMVECAVLNKKGEFMWPREAAAQAGRVKRLADKDMKFRRMLRGLDEEGNPLASPEELVGMVVDAMDTSGKWFQVEVRKVQIVAADTDDEEDSLEMESEDPRKDSGESKQVLVTFSEHGGHSEWIDVNSDRLASAGRFTLSNGDDPPSSQQKTTPSSASDGKPKVQTQVKKTSDTSEKVCTIPGYGACGPVNLGNTCYVNSAIQCVSYLPLLRAYLLSSQYKATGDLNKDNPIGTGGKLLEEFAELLRLMWSAKVGEKSPSRFRAALGKANEQFSGADQQDSQEFLSFILDVLHEDSNRVRKKPYVEGLEDDWVKQTSLPRVGEEAWRRYVWNTNFQ